VPTVRHADYIGEWLKVLKADNKAVFRAAAAAQKAADYLHKLQRAELPRSRSLVPYAARACVKGQCHSPLACSAFGYCRELNFPEALAA